MTPQAARILVVDDEKAFERLFRQRFRKQIKQGLFDFSFAQSGREALEILQKDDSFDMMLSDINMPEMDGITLIGKLHEIKPELMIIMLTAYGDMNNIRAVMNNGAYDFLLKPIDFEDLEKTIVKSLSKVKKLRQARKAEALEEMNARLRHLDQMKSQVFTNISHEFRTPLTTIKGMARQIQRNPEKWLDRAVPMLESNVEKLLQLVDQITCLAKLEEGKLILQMEKADVISFLQELGEKYRHLVLSKGIQWQMHTDLKSLEMAFDANHLAKVVSSLLSNAVKFTPKGGTIRLDISRDDLSSGRRLKIRVKDTGQGIPEFHQAFIFERFYQVDASSTRIAEGTGIGLSFVKELVDLMGGEIHMESKEGEGSTFELILPAD